jgi:hypothetical protein
VTLSKRTTCSAILKIWQSGHNLPCSASYLQPRSCRPLDRSMADIKPPIDLADMCGRSQPVAMLGVPNCLLIRDDMTASE